MKVLNKTIKEILELLDRESPLSNKQIADRTNRIKYATVRVYTSIMAASGLITHFKEVRGLYEITEEGRKKLQEG